MIKIAELYQFLKEIDEDFSPNLSSKVVLSEYAEKIQNKAKIPMFFDDLAKTSGFFY